ncbi:DUF1295 domain-containing protein [Alginatibacterium sediminis]|uniref:DUF1295 domain-containing protein n=1 Tax=Alginatibacterium sediminis TaxID=2164068 RepID=A0A420EGD5_9ALTE|nr:DUF1295 domain-containing protein [Alginatibacterium sediminis]RKF19772.1 DUF1295 domain-containing protein [Alginatibacterium sediminis]
MLGALNDDFESKLMNDAKQENSKPMQVRHFINAHKIATPFVVMGMMYLFNFWGATAWIYLALHSSYCLLWLIKEYTFRDKRFETTIHPVAGSIFVFGMLGLYWIAPYLIISRHFEAPNWIKACAVVTVVVGIFYHYVSDAHKHTQLANKKELIVNGLFSRTRNPNYLGEMLIYAGFAMLALHPLALVALVYWWSFFIRNMLQKDKSLSRYEGFEEWKNNSGLCIPKLFKT